MDSKECDLTHLLSQLTARALLWHFTSALAPHVPEFQITHLNTWGPYAGGNLLLSVLTPENKLSELLAASELLRKQHGQYVHKVSRDQRIIR